MDPRYSLGLAEDKDVDQLLEQFEEENLLSLQLGSHRNAEGFADIMPSYLQNEEGGLDRELAYRLAALKAPTKKENASNRSSPPQTTPSSDKVNAEASAAKQDMENRQGGGQANERKADVSGDENQTGDAELDPVEVASLGRDLARRLHRLRVKESASKIAQDKDIVAPNDKLLSDQERSSFVSVEKKRGEHTLEQDVMSGRDESKGGMPFIDLSRGTNLQQPPQEDPKRPRSNLFAGLFDQKERLSTKKPQESSPEDVKRRAQSLLAGVPEGARKGAGSNMKGDAKMQSLGAPQSALYRDIQGATASPDQAYDGVLRDEKKETSEVDALLAALHEDLRIRKSRQSAANRKANLEESESEQSDSGSDLSEGTVDRHAKEVTEWSKDFARLEAIGLKRERGASGSKSSRHRRRSSSDEDGTDSEEDDASSNGEDSPGTRTKRG